MENTLYLECYSGISGDMTVAALLDLGADKDGLIKTLNSIPANGYKIEISRVKKSGLDCQDFDVVLDEEHENHDHDMEYLYGHLSHEGEHHHHHHDDEHEGHHHHHHDDEHEDHHHHHDDEHECHHHHHHHHEHRGLEDIKKIIDATDLTDNAKRIANRIFEVIAEAESKAHGEPIEKVHFHEVGAIDSIVDVISVAYCIDNLNITKVVVPYLSEGSGTVRCQHGIIPVPVPAVVNIVNRYGISLELTGEMGEFVTPTGAAIVAALRTDSKLPERFMIKNTGIGAGKRKYNRPGILRAFLIE
ncbi:MAG: LarC family nickel insertion protein [Butyrivibrio sp.]|nr:LarC family nickel insertion protein [Butyrivibrio sp.]